MKTPHYPLIHANIAVLLFSSAALIGHVAALPAEIMVWGRTGFASLMLVVFMRSMAPRLKSCSIHSWRDLTLSGALLCIHWYCFFASVRFGSIAIGLITFACFPVFIIAFDRLIQRQSIPPSDIATAVGIIIGIIIMVPHSFDGPWLGWGLGFLSSVLFAGLTLMNKQLVKAIHPLDIAWVQNTVACFILSLGFITLDDIQAINTTQWMWLIVCGIICTAIAHTILVRAMQSLSALATGFIVSLEPVYGMALATILLNEPLIAQQIIGGAIVVGAVLIGVATQGHL